MKAIAQTIKNKLKEIEAENDIKILYACESGSRAWGFPSPDSDYDARFLYVHKMDWYIAINEQADTIELPISDELDIKGWEIRKCLRLLTKHNAGLYEWIQSPITYRDNTSFRKEFTKIATDAFSPVACIHHYLSMVKGFYSEIEPSDAVKLKKYLYCFRASLAANWIAENKSVPPMEIEKLSKVITKNVKLVNLMHELIRLKSGEKESYLHKRESLLDDYMVGTIEHCTKIAPMLPVVKADYAALNKYFRKTLKSK